jgi:hypothetical protein
MKTKITKKLVAAMLIMACFLMLVGMGCHAGTNTTSEADIPSETIEMTTEYEVCTVQMNDVATVGAAYEVEEEPIVLDASEISVVETRDKSELENLIQETETKLSAAQAMLESCQTLGYTDDNPVVVLANEEVANIQAVLNTYNETYAEVLVEVRNQERMEEYPAATTVWNYLTQTLGYSDAVAAGILGNMMAEVGGQTLALQPSIYGHSSNGYYGICQWSLRYYPSVNGASLEGQLDLLASTIEAEFNEFGFVSGYSYEEFLQITDEKAAALAFAKTYERCGSGSYSVRQKNATKALEYYTN